jgi:hypothetical protein
MEGQSAENPDAMQHAPSVCPFALIMHLGGAPLQTRMLHLLSRCTAVRCHGSDWVD